MSSAVQDIVADVTTLVSPPDIWVRIHEVVRNPKSSTSDVAGITMQDPALTANILKIVNSAFYNFPKKIDTVSRAITVIGMDDLFSLVTAITAANVFSNIPSTISRPEVFWRHSLSTGIISRRLARECRVLNGERLYVAGLLHDIGSLVLYSKFPDQATEALMAANGDEEVIYQVEKELFGYTHADIGAELLRLWRLPDTLVEAVAWHHEPARATQGTIDAAIVHIANVAANRRAVGSFVGEGESYETQPDPIAWTITGLDPAILDTIGEDLEEELHAALSILKPRMSSSG